MPSTLPARIQSARRYARLSQQALADRIGVSRPAVSQWETEGDKGTAPNRDNLAAISRITGAPMDWLLDDSADVEPNWLVPQEWETDERIYGEMPGVRFSFRNRVADEHPGKVDPIASLAASVHERELPYSPEAVKDLARFALAVQRDFVFVPLLDIRVAAGAGRADASRDVLAWYAFRREWLVDDMRMDPTQCGLVIARGDSGEPEIRDREQLLVDFRRTVITEPGFYVLAIEGEYIVKQAQRDWDGGITISSANPAYAPSRVPPERIGDLTVIGIVRSQQRRR